MSGTKERRRDGTPTELVAAADAALYEAKAAGRNRVSIALEAPVGG